MAKTKVHVIEDEADIREVIEYNLKREGFEVVSSGDGEGGLRTIRQSPPDLVMLDLMLPGIGGIDICRKLKEDRLTQAIPIIMVSAKGEESDIVLGLSMGADDYVTKPFSPKELVARVKAVLRRTSSEAATEQERWTQGGVTVDAARYEVRIDGEPVTLTATEFRLLHFLGQHPGRVFTRDQLLNRVIGENAIVTDRNIDVHIMSVRKKLGPYRDLLETIRGVGYRFRDHEGR